MKVYFQTFGCRVNQYETQVLRERMLAERSSEAVDDWASADLCVVNTCTVTQEADREALTLIRRIARDNPAARLVVTGCLATRDPGAVLAQAPAALVAGNEDKQSLPAMLGCAAAPAWAGVTGLAGRSRAFVKVQDGCNMSCAFCVIPAIRPRLSSRPFPEVLSEVRGLSEAGQGEVVLCGIRLGRYLAQDGAGRRVDLVGLLEGLLELPGDFRVRLSSLEITDLGARLIHLMSSSGGRLCPSLHLPLQSGSEAVLKAMGRWYSAAFYARRVEALRAALPEAAVFADVMAGYPAESEADFEESLAFARRAGLSGLHVFRYSARPGTPAAALPALPEAVVAARASRLRALDRDLREAHAARAVGGERRLWMELDGRDGLSEDFLSVRLDSHPGRGFVRARVTGREGARVRGEAIGAGP